jgi:hypothetical protein
LRGRPNLTPRSFARAIPSAATRPDQLALELDQAGKHRERPCAFVVSAHVSRNERKLAPRSLIVAS